MFSYVNCPLAHLLWRSVYADPSIIFKIGLFVFLLLWHKSSLHIPDAIPVADT